MNEECGKKEGQIPAAMHELETQVSLLEDAVSTLMGALRPVLSPLGLATEKKECDEANVMAPLASQLMAIIDKISILRLSIDGTHERLEL